METKISIIIPTYNVAGYLEKCLDSLLAQTFKEYEIIVVDDGSTDKTPGICDQYAEKDNRITIIHKKNEGVSKARNTGIDIAKGEYILFYDGDDFVEPYTCEELYNMAKEKNVDTIIYGYHRYENGKIKETCYPIFDEGIYDGDSINRTLLPRFIGISGESVNQWISNKDKALYVENPALWRTMVTRKIIIENNIVFNKNLKVGEDTIFISEYLSYAQKCYVHQKCYYYLVTRETSTIYVYEKNPLAKLDGKIRLLEARNELSKKMYTNYKFNIEPFWCGTVIMSVMEIAFLMAKKHPDYGFFERYRLFMRYVKVPDVRKIIKEFRLKIVLGVKVVPFLLLKSKLYFILFLCVSVLQFLHYEFDRS